jgi:hypothetical protein
MDIHILNFAKDIFNKIKKTTEINNKMLKPCLKEKKKSLGYWEYPPIFRLGSPRRTHC